MIHNKPAFILKTKLLVVDNRGSSFIVENLFSIIHEKVNVVDNYKVKMLLI